MHALIFAMADDVALGLAPAIISSMLRRRTRSSGSPVSTWTCQGWVFIDDGARFAISRISSITARGTGLFLKPRTLLRVWTSVSNSIASSVSSVSSLFRRVLIKTWMAGSSPAMTKEGGPRFVWRNSAASFLFMISRPIGSTGIGTT